jgi:type II secretory pathway pseudopilin PulG
VSALIIIGILAVAAVVFLLGWLTGRTSARDRFASAALQGMLADTKVDGAPIRLAHNAYRVADAMLKARSAP